MEASGMTKEPCYMHAEGAGEKHFVQICISPKTLIFT